MNLINKIVNTYKLGLAYDGLFKEFQNLLKVVNTERAQFTKTINNLENENILMYKDIEDLQAELNESPIQPKLGTFSLKTTISNLKKIMDSKPFKYPFRGDGKSVDIKYALVPKSNELIKKYGELIDEAYKPTTPLECVEAVQKYFIFKKKPRYVTDTKKFGKRDYWESPDVFLASWEGDCDGTAIAMHSLIKYLLYKKNFKKHYDRLYIQVNSNYKERHMNNLWLHSDGYFYTVESTMDLSGTFRRKWLKVPLKNDSFYTKTEAVANLNGSHYGSRAFWKCFL